MSFDISIPVVQPLPSNLQRSEENSVLIEQWKEVPLYLNQKDSEKFENQIGLVFTSLQQTLPSAITQLTLQEIKSSQTIRLIDDTFKQAVRSYRRDLDIAMIDDLAWFRNGCNIPNSWMKAPAVSTLRMMEYAPNVFAIQLVTLPILAFLGAFRGLIQKNKFEKELIQYAQSTHRQNWLSRVIVLENERIKTAIQQIMQRATVICRDIQEGEKVDFSRINELKALDKLHTKLSDGRMMTVFEKPILAHIQEILDVINS